MEPICFNPVPSAAYLQAAERQVPILAMTLPNGVVVVVQPNGAMNNVVNEMHAITTFPNLQTLQQ